MKRTLIYRLVLVVRWVFIHTPRDLALLIGSAVGLTLWFTQRKDKFRACRHLQCAYGDRYSLLRYKSFARNAFINSGHNLCDAFRLETKFETEIAPLIDVVGLENFLQAYNLGKGVICATGHIGNFELLAAFMGHSGFKTAVIGRELYDPRLDGLLVRNRQANHIENISTTQPRQLVAKLRDGFAIGALIDNDSQKLKSAFVESYGRLAYTPVGITHIGLRLGSAFVPLTCRRIGKRYQIRFFPAVGPDILASDSIIAPKNKSELRQMKVISITAQIRAILDSEVDKDPSQWIWVHNRWRTKPDHEHKA